MLQAWFCYQLVIDGCPSFLSFLSAFSSVVSIACVRPPATPDPHTSTMFSISGNFLALGIGFKNTLVQHLENNLWPMSTIADPTIQTSSSTFSSLMNYCAEFAPSRVHVWHFLVGRFCPHLYLMFLRQVLADDGEPKTSHPLDSYAPNGFLAIQKHPVALVWLSQLLQLSQVWMNKSFCWIKKLSFAQFDGIKLLACCHPISVLTLACTIYGESPCHSALSSVIHQRPEYHRFVQIS